MSRRIEVELTSNRADGSWTWRAAGAREPRGTVEESKLYAGAQVGDVVRVDADFDIDGISILAVIPPKGMRKEAGRVEIVGSGASFEPVTQKLAGPSDRPRRSDDRGPRPGARGPRPEGRPDGRTDRRPGSTRPGGGDAHRDRRPHAAPEGEGSRPDRPRRPDGDRPQRDRPNRAAFAPELPAKPKAKRLRPGRSHRNAVLAGLPDEHRPIADHVLQGGLPAVRQAIAEQNALLKADGKAEINPAGVLALAEQLMPALRVAEWLDRADAAKADMDELDLRDLRSVVVAAEDPAVARDENARQLTVELKAALSERQDREHNEWLAEITTSLDVGRSIRALRMSSRPPKAGVRFPAELAVRLAAATTETLTPDASSDRWVAVLDALAFSPIRNQVVPSGPPAQPSAELTTTVQRLARQLPAIAAIFGIELPTGPAPRTTRPERPARPQKPRAPKPPPTAATDTPAAEAPAAVDTPPVDTPPVDTPPIDTPPIETAPVDNPPVDTPPIDTPPVETGAADVAETPVVEPEVAHIADATPAAAESDNDDALKAPGPD